MWCRALDVSCFLFGREVFFFSRSAKNSCFRGARKKSGQQPHWPAAGRWGWAYKGIPCRKTPSWAASRENKSRQAWIPGAKAMAPCSAVPLTCLLYTSDAADE